MSISTVLLLIVAAFLSGMVNAIAGGGTFLTFGVLTLAGLPPVAANATSSFVQFPGYITSTLAYLREIRVLWKGALALLLVSVAGSLAGALFLMSLSNPAFRRMVPWLLLAATAVFAVGPRLSAKATVRQERYDVGPLGLATQGLTACYGGFFGAGMGIMMLASLGITTHAHYHRLNALKNLLSIVIAAVAIAVFSTGGLVSWIHAALMLPAVALGGYAGVHAARRAPQGLLRGVVVAVGILLAGYYFFSE